MMLKMWRVLLLLDDIFSKFKAPLINCHLDQRERSYPPTSKISPAGRDDRCFEKTNLHPHLLQ